jgi:radical SAM protein with 4Fe4S-binding SPASM domain
MSYETFKNAIDVIVSLPVKPKVLMLDGHGEPLVNPEIVKMIEYAKAKNAAERIEIVTNGSLLSHEMSDSLISAGLDRMRISLQGLDNESYKKTCDTDIDFDEFTDNLRYFFEHKKSTDVYVKIIDIALNKTEDEFHSIFDSISNTAVIEHLFPNIRQIDHEKLGGEMKYSKEGTSEARRVDVCAMPFYMLVILPNGDVTGCCKIEPPSIFGNINKNSVIDIWQSKNRFAFLNMQISDRNKNVICSDCQSPDYGTQDGDFLDNYKTQLNRIYNIM